MTYSVNMIRETCQILFEKNSLKPAISLHLCDTSKIINSSHDVRPPDCAQRGSC